VPKRIYLHEGERFGRLVVSKGDHICPDSNQTLSKCLCDCGVEVNRMNTALRTGRVKSCGCLKDETSLKNIGAPDMPIRRYKLGDVFGSIIIVSERYKKSEIMYVCECQLCGEKVEVKRANIERGQWTHKGCELNQMKAGGTYGCLTFIEIENVEGKKLAHCRCLCGVETYKRPHDLRAGKVKRCGHKCTARV